MKGIFENAKKGSLIIDCSTIDPIATRNLSKEAKENYDIDLIDAPVSGGVTGMYYTTIDIILCLFILIHATLQGLSRVR